MPAWSPCWPAPLPTQTTVPPTASTPVPFEFTMFGDWIVTVEAVVDTDTGDTIIANFDLSVDADGAKLTKP